MAKDAGLPAVVFSIGHPPLWRQQLSAQGTAVTRDGRSGATFSYGVYRAFSKPPIAALNPVLGRISGTAVVGMLLPVFNLQDLIM